MNSRYLYICIFGFLATAIPVAVMAINFAIDPWGYFNTTKVEGFNWVKPDLAGYEREVEAHRITTLRPKGLIMGASTSDMGLDPEASAWDVEPVYNVAVGMGSVMLAQRLLLHALEFGKPEKVIIGLDFGMYTSALRNSTGISPASLSVMADGKRNREYFGLNYYANAFSLKMLQSSFKTFMLNFKNEGAVTDYHLAYTDTGMLNPQNFEIDPWYTHRSYFQATIRHSVDAYWSPTAENTGSTFDTLNEMLVTTCENDIDLYILLSPSHAYILVGQDTMGLTPAWEAWKKSLVLAVHSYAEQSGCNPVPIWDFSGYNEITTELILNKKGDENKPRWYGDPIHYKKELGNDILNRIFGREISQPELRDFGTRLTNENIDAHIEQNQIRAERYMETRKDEVALVKESVAKELKKLNRSVPDIAQQ